MTKIKILYLTLLMPFIGNSQDLSTVFLDSIQIENLSNKFQTIDTIIKNTHYSITNEVNDDIKLFGNLNLKGEPHGAFRYTFKSDMFKFVKGDYSKGKRNGIWVITCGARRNYKKGKIKSTSTCPF